MNESTSSAEIAATAARLVVEEGMTYGPAKRKAAQLLGYRGARDGALPDNDTLEDEVRAYLALFHSESQPAELAALRAVAVQWMERLAEFRPHLTGAVWRGTATKLDPVQIELYCDDSKAAEIALIDQHVEYSVQARRGPRGQMVDMLQIETPCAALGGSVSVCLNILDHDDLRGLLRPDARGRAPRGDLAALRRLLQTP